MTLDHIAALFFDGRREAAKKRAQKLKAAGLLSERPRRSTQPSALHLTPKALRVLGEHGALAAFPKLNAAALGKRLQVSDLTLAHELEVMDIKAAFAAAIRATSHLELVEFSTWPLLNQFSVKSVTGAVTTKPDAFIRIHERESDGEKSEHAFYLEVDRSTESQTVLAAKARQYGRYYRSGSFAERWGGSPRRYADFPFRVLAVLRTDARRTNAARSLLRNDPPTLSQVWLTTTADIRRNPLGAIWTTPVDSRTLPVGRHAAPVFRCLL
jgi:hypothetical protein